MNDATITSSDNGPYLVQGNVTILDVGGNQYEVNGTIALCRCGHSSTKPFCDGSHEKSNFAAVNRARPYALVSSTTAPAVASR